MNTANALRMCPECMSTDAHHPTIQGCQSCAAMVAYEGNAFLNTVITEEPIFTDAGELAGSVGITPREIIRRVVQPWHTLFRMLTLT